MSPQRSTDQAEPTDKSLPGETTEHNDDDEDITLREDIRFVLQNDIDYVIHSIYSSHHEV